MFKSSFASLLPHVSKWNVPACCCASGKIRNPNVPLSGVRPVFQIPSRPCAVPSKTQGRGQDSVVPRLPAASVAIHSFTVPFRNVQYSPKVPEASSTSVNPWPGIAAAALANVANGACSSGTGTAAATPMTCRAFPVGHFLGPVRRACLPAGRPQAPAYRVLRLRTD